MSSRKAKRNISVDRKVYKWVVGGPGIILWDEYNKQYKASIEEVTGLSVSVFEKGQEKGTHDGMITPAMVAKWIKTHLHVTANQPIPSFLLPLRPIPAPVR